jgi:hypothetical protein
MNENETPKVIAMRALLQAWEPNFRCLACDRRFIEEPCEEDIHATVRDLVGETPE